MTNFEIATLLLSGASIALIVTAIFVAVGGYLSIQHLKENIRNDVTEHAKKVADEYCTKIIDDYFQKVADDKNYKKIVKELQDEDPAEEEEEDKQ